MMLTSIMESSNKVSSTQNPSVVLVYLVFLTISVLVYRLIAEGEFSAVLTISAIFECLAFSLLGVQFISTGSVRGISAKSLQLEAIALACRLSSTTWLEGYLPNDNSGDFLYQIIDFLSLGMVLWLLHRVLNVQRKTYDASEDAMPLAPLLLGALVLASLLHGDLNDRPLFDTLWMCGLFVSAVAVLPQLWMITRSQTRVPPLISHFIAVMAAGRLLSGSYMWHAHSEITCEPWVGDFNHTGYAILAAHALHLLLLGDFAYFYVKNLAKGGMHAPLQLPETWVV